MDRITVTISGGIDEQARSVRCFATQIDETRVHVQGAKGKGDLAGLKARFADGDGIGQGILQPEIRRHTTREKRGANAQESVAADVHVQFPVAKRRLRDIEIGRALAGLGLGARDQQLQILEVQAIAQEHLTR